MTGTFIIHHQPAVILFDSGATHSFISLKFGAKIGLDFRPTKGAYMIATPSGKIASNQICRNVPIQLGSNLVKTDLLLLDLEGMDILLGMDWMTRHRVSLDISFQAVEIDSPYQGTTIFYLLQRKCINSCAYAVEAVKLEDIPIVCEYPDVFPDNLPGMPPDTLGIWIQGSRAAGHILSATYFSNLLEDKDRRLKIKLTLSLILRVNLSIGGYSIWSASLIAPHIKEDLTTTRGMSTSQPRCSQGRTRRTPSR
jgi:hypothetical protein